MPVRFLRRRQNDWGTVLKVVLYHAQRPYFPLPEVWAHRKRHKVSEDDVPTQSTTVGNVIGLRETRMHEGVGVIL